MPRFYVSPAEWPQERIRLAPEPAHHLLNVLRCRAGDPVTIFDGRGHEAGARVADTGRGTAVLEVGARSEQPPPRVAIVLVQALPKAQKMDLIVQKATELGASAVQPVSTARSLLRLDGEPALERVRRWQKIAIGAAEQCGTLWVPQVEPIRDLASFLEADHGCVPLLLASLAPDARPMAAALREIRPGGRQRVGILIGPEGDLTPEEVQAARQAGAVAVSFGSRVLRTETAALYALSVLDYELRRD